MALQPRSEMRLYDTTGAMIAVFDNWRSLNLDRKLNDFDQLTFSIPGQDARRTLFTLDSILELWRTIPGSPPYREAVCFNRTSQRTITQGSHRIFTTYARGLNDLLRRRSIMYAARTAGGLKSAPADDVIKEFVRENCGSLATLANGRKRAGVMPGFTVAANTSLAPNWAGQRAWQNLLSVLQEISDARSVDFEVRRTDTPGSGAVALEFVTFYPRLGTDRSTTVKFSPELGNMDSPSYTLSRTEEVNAVVVLGQGQGSDRRAYPQEDAATVDDSPWNAIETTRDSRDENSISAYISAADEALQELKAQPEFKFTILQTDSLQYGRDYFMGDLITARFDEIEETRKLIGLTINISEGRETLSNFLFSDKVVV